MNWKPIIDAPYNEVICTDKGFSIFKDRYWGIYSRWYLCDVDGDIPRCADDGYCISAINPTKWISLEEIGLVC